MEILKNTVTKVLPPREISCFKAYDLRGILDKTIDEDIAYRVGRSFVDVLNVNSVVVGYDARASSQDLAAAVIRGIRDAGAAVIDIKLAGTEEVYSATSHFGVGGGIEITASHNPINYNGMKIVAEGSRPVDPDAELAEVHKVAEAGRFKVQGHLGGYRDAHIEARSAYVKKVLSFIDVDSLRPLKLVVNCGNGAAAAAYTAIKQELENLAAPLEFVDQFLEPDASFPNGIPNPLLVENQPVTREKVLASQADIGVAFDGDFDRCFFFDETGQFIPGEYIVGLLADIFLDKEPAAAIVHDPRVVLNTRDVIAAKGGQAMQSKTGHAFVKQVMRKHEAVYGGEMSAHHYFRDFSYCDSGMIPWLLICELMGRTGKPLSTLLAERMQKFPSSGEHNFKISEPAKAISAVVDAYKKDALIEDRSDGVSLEFNSWRFNLRSSNTEPVVRLNIESRNDTQLVNEKFQEISAILNQFAS